MTQKSKWIILLILLILLVLGNITMGIKHVDIKTSGDKGYASEWNKDHVIDDDVECAKHQHKEHVIENRTDFPAGPVEGQIIYRTDENKLYVFDGAAWAIYLDTNNYTDYVAILVGTHYWSCPGNNFRPTQPDIHDVAYSVSHGWVRADANSISLTANVNLPHGAVVTGVIVYGSEADMSWGLIREDISAGTGAEMASALYNVEDNTINFATIDNDNYAYFLQTKLWIDDTDQIYGARITYTL